MATETNQIEKKFLIDVYTAYQNYRFTSKANAVTFYKYRCNKRYP